MRLVWLALLVAILALSAGCRSGGEDAALTEAEELFLSGRPVEARQAFERFVRRYPDSKKLPQALLGLAMIDHFQLENYDRALEGYRRVTALFPDHPAAPRALENMVDLFLVHHHNYPAAINALETLKRDYARRTGRGDHYQERIAWAYFKLENYDKAREAYRSLLKEYPDSTLAERAMVGVADTFYVQDRIPEALKAYREALAKFPGGEMSVRIRFRIANCLEETGRLEEAKALYTELIESYPNPKAVRIRLAGVESRLKKGVR